MGKRQRLTREQINKKRRKVEAFLKNRKSGAEGNSKECGDDAPKAEASNDALKAEASNDALKAKPGVGESREGNIFFTLPIRNTL